MTKHATATATALLKDASTADAGIISRRGNSRRTIAYVPRESRHFARFASEKSVADCDVIAVIVIEALSPHPDSLSVSGIWLNADDEFAPTRIGSAIVVRDSDADHSHLLRADGALWRRMNEAGW